MLFELAARKRTIAVMNIRAYDLQLVEDPDGRIGRDWKLDGLRKKETFAGAFPRK